MISLVAKNYPRVGPKMHIKCLRTGVCVCGILSIPDSVKSSNALHLLIYT